VKLHRRKAFIDYKIDDQDMMRGAANLVMCGPDPLTMNLANSPALGPPVFNFRMAEEYSANNLGSLSGRVFQLHQDGELLAPH
jgi:hypothetical protein